MLIPVRCFTCGEIMGDKWKPFIVLSNKERNNNNDETDNNLNIEIIDIESKTPKTIEAKVLDKMNIKKMCCRRMLLSNVHLISYIN